MLQIYVVINTERFEIGKYLGKISGQKLHTNLNAGSGELISRWTAAGDGVGEDRGPTEAALRGFLGVSGRCPGCIVKELSMLPPLNYHTRLYCTFQTFPGNFAFPGYFPEMYGTVGSLL